MTDPLLPSFPNLLRERSPAAAAQDAALRHGIGLRDATAREIAAAVLEFADGEHRVSMEVAAPYWPECREDVLRRLRRQLAMELADSELLPTARSREVVTRPLQQWEPVKVELVVPVRRAARLYVSHTYRCRSPGYPTATPVTVW